MIQKKHQKNAPFIDDVLKTRGIKYSHVETWLLFDPLHLNFWLRAWWVLF